MQDQANIENEYQTLLQTGQQSQDIYVQIGGNTAQNEWIYQVVFTGE